MPTPTRLSLIAAVLALTACGRAGLLPRTVPTPAAIGDEIVAVSVQAEEGPSLEEESGPSDDAPMEPPAPIVEAPPPAWDIEVEPYESHERVEHYVQRFSGPLRSTFEVALERRSRYAPMIHAKLRAGGLPEDMIYLALIESWYDPHAYSAAAAVGMWQFMTRTAKSVGLRVDWWVDERRDPVAATDAAIRYLNQLHDNFGSIYLASAAYNGGPGRVSRGLQANAEVLEGAAGDDLFFALSDNTKALRPETRDYVPKLIAAALVGKDPTRYGVEAREVQPFAWDSVAVAANVPLAAVAKAIDVSVDTLKDYNPHILRGMTPPTGAATWLRVPVGRAEGFSAAFEALPEVERVATKRVVTREGDYITKIAKANGLTAKELNWYNPQATRLPNGNLHAGQRIVVPRRDVADAARDVPNPSIERYGASSTYVVKRGDNLSVIARKHGTTVAQLRQINRLRGDIIRPGQRLRVR
ncbi:MAG: transglycosylase SLT domain-containing protein [Gemmatimonadaceae bacterium]|nr:transglycosylase SLT domain-containing protein [Gemmatimonadaceae bacterium]